jgi:hypothetical protein
MTPALFGPMLAAPPVVERPPRAGIRVAETVVDGVGIVPSAIAAFPGRPAAGLCAISRAGGFAEPPPHVRRRDGVLAVDRASGARRLPGIAAVPSGAAPLPHNRHTPHEDWVYLRGNGAEGWTSCALKTAP